jgi:hypothetical protein
MRLRDMLHDPAIVDTNAAERAFRSIYRDVYDYLRAVMFTKDGTVIWTFAGQLERAGFSISRAVNGLNLTVGAHGEHSVTDRTELHDQRGHCVHVCTYPCRRPVTGNKIQFMRYPDAVMNPHGAVRSSHGRRRSGDHSFHACSYTVRYWR